MPENTEIQPAGYVDEMGDAILLDAFKDAQHRDHHRRIMANVAPIAGLDLLFRAGRSDAQRLAASWKACGRMSIDSIVELVKIGGGVGGVPSLIVYANDIKAERDAMKGQRDVLASLLNAALDVVRNVEAEGSTEADLLRELLTKGERAVLEVFGGRIPRTPVELAAGDEHCPKCEGTGRVRFDQCTECVGGGVKLPF